MQFLKQLEHNLRSSLVSEFRYFENVNELYTLILLMIIALMLKHDENEYSKRNAEKFPEKFYSLNQSVKSLSSQ